MRNEKIGDYIHARYRRYLYYGTGTTARYASDKKEEAALETQHEFLSTQAETFKHSGLNAGKIQEIEDLLNFFIGKSNDKMPKSFNWSQEEAARIIKRVQERTLAKLREKAPSSITFDFNSMSAIEMTDDFGVYTDEKWGDLTVKGKRLSRSAIERRLLEMDRLYKTLDIETTKAESLLQQLSALYRQWGILQAETYETHARLTPEMIARRTSFAQELNDLWDSFKRTSENYWSGRLTEVYAETVFNTAYELIATETQNLLKPITDIATVVGQKGSKYILNKKYFAVHKLGKDGKITKTQDKVDLQFMLQGIDNPINATIKNSPSSSPYIHVHTGTSVYKLVQEYGEFVNHYFNITANHYDRNPSTALITQAHNTLRVTAFVRALVGGMVNLSDDGKMGTNDIANILIYSSPTTGFKVIDTTTIINNILKMLTNSNSAIQFIVDSKKGYSDLPSGSWNNPPWVGGKHHSWSSAYKRISGLVANLHAMKLSMMFSKEAIFNTGI